MKSEGHCVASTERSATNDAADEDDAEDGANEELVDDFEVGGM